MFYLYKHVPTGKRNISFLFVQTCLYKHWNIFQMFAVLTATKECCLTSMLIWAFVNSLFLFQLIEKELTIFLHTPNARLHRLSSWTALVTARCRLCPKQGSLSQSKILAAEMMLLPLSVVRQIWCTTSKLQASNAAFIASAKLAPVWSWGKYCVCKHLLHSCHSSLM